MGSTMTAQVLSVTAARSALRVAEREEAYGPTSGPNPARYFLLPVTASAPIVRPWNAVLERDELDALGLAARDRLLAAGELERRLVGLASRIAEERRPLKARLFSASARRSWLSR
jgi:hypothetical protein